MCIQPHAAVGPLFIGPPKNWTAPVSSPNRRPAQAPSWTIKIRRLGTAASKAVGRRPRELAGIWISRIESRTSCTRYEPLAAVRSPATKLGCTSAAMQTQMAAPAPNYGLLYADMVLPDGEPADQFVQPRAEPENAIVLKRDLAGSGLQLRMIREVRR